MSAGVKFFDRPGPPFLQETSMNTRISSKLAALGIALMLNSMLLFGMANLFDAPKAQSATMSMTSHCDHFLWLI
jgi:hypothetical protein